MVGYHGLFGELLDFFDSAGGALLELHAEYLEKWLVSLRMVMTRDLSACVISCIVGQGIRGGFECYVDYWKMVALMDGGLCRLGSWFFFLVGISLL